MYQKVKLNIGGVELPLNTNEEPKYMQQLADEVDSRVRELTKNSTFISTTTASIITALEFCDKLKKNYMEIDELSQKIKALEDELSGLRLESDEARREIDRINNENQALRAKAARK